MDRLQLKCLAFTSDLILRLAGLFRGPSAYRLRLGCLAVGACWLGLHSAGAQETYSVYQVSRRLALYPRQKIEPDYFVNLGTLQGAHLGSILVVYRRLPMYQLMKEQVYRDLSFPIATLRVIHAESSASVARLEKMGLPSQTPGIEPWAIMMGDEVRLPLQQKGRLAEGD